MSVLTSLKAAAAADLASSKANVANYVRELEASVASNKILVTGVGVAGVVVGWLGGHFL